MRATKSKAETPRREPGTTPRVSEVTCFVGFVGGTQTVAAFPGRSEFKGAGAFPFAHERAC
jgi:hypothetical protein